MKSLTFIFLLILAPVISTAEVTKVVQTELALESRIRKIVNSVDPDAQVLVRIELHSVKMKLPGTALEFNGPTAIQKVDVEDIQSINIKVLTTLPEFPTWVRELIENNYRFNNVKTILVVERFDDSALERMVELNPSRSIVRWAAESISKSGPYMIPLVGSVFAFLVILLGAVFFYLPSRMKSFIELLVAGIKEAFGGRMGEGDAEAVHANRSELPSSEKESSAPSEGELNLPTDGIVELFADCYWTSLDAYAKWIWDNLKPDQRGQVLDSWPQMVEYSDFLQGFSATREQFHLHPYYLRSQPLRDINMTDLSRFVEVNPSEWQRISPLRQRHVEIPVAKKISIFESKEKGTGGSQPEWPKASFPKRNFEARVDFGLLTELDDQAIFDNPSLIPDHLKDQAASLAWVALLPDDARRKFLEKYSALQLTQIMCGPENILEIIKAAVPEKKRKLLESYAGQVSPRRDSPLFVEFCREAGMHLAKANQSGDHLAKVAKVA